MAALASIFLLLFLIAGSALAVYRWGWISLALLVPLGGYTIWRGMYLNSQEQLINLLPPLVIGALGGFSLKNAWPVKRYLVLCSVFMSVLLSGGYYYMKIYQGRDIIRESGAQVSEMLKNSRIPEEERKQLSKDLEEWAPTASNIVPFSTFFYGLILSSLALAMIRPLTLGRESAPVPEGKGLDFFRLSDYTIFIFIAGWLLFMLADKTQHPVLNAAGLNLGLITSLLYLVQAMGVIKFMIQKKGLPSSLLPFSIFLMLIMGIEVILFSAVFMTGIGACDLWADFRKLGKTDS